MTSTSPTAPDPNAAEAKRRSRSGERATGSWPGAHRRAATLIAALVGLGGTGGQPAPIAAVSSAFIDRTPPWLKDLAVAPSAPNDKRALLVGVVIVWRPLRRSSASSPGRGSRRPWSPSPDAAGAIGCRPGGPLDHVHCPRLPAGS